MSLLFLTQVFYFAGLLICTMIDHFANTIYLKEPRKMKLRNVFLRAFLVVIWPIVLVWFAIDAFRRREEYDEER